MPTIVTISVEKTDIDVGIVFKITEQELQEPQELEVCNKLREVMQSILKQARTVDNFLTQEEEPRMIVPSLGFPSVIPSVRVQYDLSKYQEKGDEEKR